MPLHVPDNKKNFLLFRICQFSELIKRSIGSCSAHTYPSSTSIGQNRKQINNFVLMVRQNQFLEVGAQQNSFFEKNQTTSRKISMIESFSKVLMVVGVFMTLTNIKDGAFSKNKQKLLTILAIKT